MVVGIIGVNINALGIRSISTDTAPNAAERRLYMDGFKPETAPEGYCL